MSAPTHGQTLGTVAFQTSQIILEILKMDTDGVKRDPIDATNMQVQKTVTSTGGNYGNKVKIPSIYIDPGVLKLQVNHNPGQMIPLVADPEYITWTWGPYSSSQESQHAVGFIKSYNVDGPLDGKPLTATMEIELTDVQVEDGTYDNTGAVAVTLAS